MDTTVGLKEKPKRIGEKVSKVKSLFIPDDIIINNILMRLPAKYLIQCRLVCKGWMNLTSDPDFVDLHFRHHSNISMIMLPYSKSKTVDYFFLHKWWELQPNYYDEEPVRTKLMIQNFQFDPYSCYAKYSHSGLVVFKTHYFHQGIALANVIVANPMYPENVIIITLSPEIQWTSYIYGVFYHPILKEYCSLWMIQQASSDRSKWIKLLTLGSNPSMKTITNPFTHRVERRGSYPIFIDKYLYWLLAPENDEFKYRSDIMQFDIVSEEFTVMPCPVPVDDTICISYNNTYLLNNDGTLSFFLILPRKVTIWRLEDHAQQLWTTADYPFSEELYLYRERKVPIPFSVQYYKRRQVPRAIAVAVVDGKLALFSRRRLIVYNLMLGTLYWRKTQYNEHICFCLIR